MQNANPPEPPVRWTEADHQSHRGHDGDTRSMDTKVTINGMTHLWNLALARYPLSTGKLSERSAVQAGWQCCAGGMPTRARVQPEKNNARRNIHSEDIQSEDIQSEDIQSEDMQLEMKTVESRNQG